MKKMKVGIIGCGTIGGELARACQQKLKDKVELAALFDIDEEKALSLQASLKNKVPVAGGRLELIKRSSLVVEAASVSVSARILESCVKAGKDCLIMSVGGLMGKEGLLRRAAEKNVRIFIPSGAICGLDGLKSAASGKIDSVTLTTRKPPRALSGAPFIEKHGIDLYNIKSESIIFEGSAEEAVKGFPQNINVAAVLSLAGLGAKNTKVKIVTSPDYTENTHEVEVLGEFGSLRAVTNNLPSAANPKTSALAIFSAIATLKAAASSVRIGT